eukprot:NODE_1607_length_826_cov_240.187902_g1247_i0.p1 GENE.NODE_1607_length_826_cov_240.187902_g1247_i0~~NODE_1607_length_826_cov_240.187902_g1247_i0.p1  ORF type:complete len:253 (-),score=63.69 NODE_1607_length_826_cov_240.187902_g1247_i0:67-744(-)
MAAAAGSTSLLPVGATGHTIALSVNPFVTPCLGSELWPAAQRLISFLVDTHAADYFVQKRVLEIGAGLGAVGLALGRLGAMVTITDQLPLLPLLQHNVSLNFPDCDRVHARELNWAHPLPVWARDADFSLIVASDIVYDGMFFADLLRTLNILSHTDTDIFFAIPHRDEAQPFFEEAAGQFDMELVKEHPATTKEDTPSIGIYRLSKKCDRWTSHRKGGKVYLRL